VRSLPLSVLLGVFLAAPVEAALVVLEEGRHLKVTAYELVGEERIRLSLHGGGVMVLPVERVERIVDDELDPGDFLVPPGAKAAAPVLPRRSVRTPSGRRNPPRSSGSTSWRRRRRRTAWTGPVAAVIRVESNWRPGRVAEGSAARCS
jgi:hypothetical protein